MKRLLLLFIGIALGAGVVVWVEFRQRRRELDLLTTSKANSDRLALLVASSMAINSAFQSHLAGVDKNEGSPITEVEVPVSLQASPAVNEVAFNWNGRNLLDSKFVSANGVEHPGLVLVPTNTGFTVISNEALVGTLHLFLFS